MRDITQQILQQPIDFHRMSEKTTRIDIYMGKTKRIIGNFPEKMVQVRVLLGKTTVKTEKLLKSEVPDFVKFYLKRFLLDVGYTNEKDAFLIYLKEVVPKQHEDEEKEE